MTQTEQELDGLVKRLEAPFEIHNGRGSYTIGPMIMGMKNPDGPEAATAIQSLRAELSSAKATIERLEQSGLDAQKRIAELEEALRPLEDAKIDNLEAKAKAADENWHDSGPQIEFEKVAIPTTILALIATVKTLKNKRDKLPPFKGILTSLLEDLDYYRNRTWKDKIVEPSSAELKAREITGTVSTTLMSGPRPVSEDCILCNGEKWVCEAHPYKAWGGGSACCGAPGMPCSCNPINKTARGTNHD